MSEDEGLAQLAAFRRLPRQGSTGLLVADVVSLSGFERDGAGGVSRPAGDEHVVGRICRRSRLRLDSARARAQ